jgi:hypothetical protein
MTEAELFRMKALIDTFEDGGPVKMEDVREAIALLLRNAVDNFYAKETL